MVSGRGGRGELVITAGNGKQFVDTVTVTIGKFYYSTHAGIVCWP